MEEEKDKGIWVVVKEELEVEDTVLQPDIQYPRGQPKSVADNSRVTGPVTSYSLTLTSGDAALHACSCCEQAFETSEAMELHVRTRHKYFLYSCDVCDKYYTTKESLERHISLNSGVHRCDSCVKSFHTEESLKSHECSSTRPKFRCEYCGKYFQLERYLSWHMERHLRAEKYRCAICEKVFSVKSYYNKHVLRHTRGKTCKICNMYFSNQSWKDHLKSHKTLHRCNLCHKKFIRESSLVKHRASNHQVASYECDFCNKCFRGRRALVRHLLFHVGQRLPCSVCNKQFPNESTRKDHMITHREDKPYECTICKKTYKYATVLKKHIKWHSDPGFHCTTCGASCYTKKAMANHRLKHTTVYTCPLCGQTVQGLDAFKQHTSGHTAAKPNNRCKICRETFHTKLQLTEHMAVHGDGERFRCGPCGGAFGSKAQLEKHTKVCASAREHAGDACADGAAPRAAGAATVEDIGPERFAAIEIKIEPEEPPASSTSPGSGSGWLVNVTKVEPAVDVKVEVLEEGEGTASDVVVKREVQNSPSREGEEAAQSVRVVPVEVMRRFLPLHRQQEQAGEAED